jgi:hypothetical protein
VPGGTYRVVILLVIGLGVAGAGIAMAAGGVRRTFRKQLRLAQMSVSGRGAAQARHHPLGPWLLVVVALGLVTFGIYL